MKCSEETEAAQSGRMYFWKDSAGFSLLWFICSDDFTHTVLIPPLPPSLLPSLLPFTFLRGIGIPMETVSSTTLLTAETQQQLSAYPAFKEKKKHAKYNQCICNLFYATAIQWKRQSLLPHYN